MSQLEQQAGGDANNVWVWVWVCAVGADSTVLHFDGSIWRSQDTGAFQLHFHRVHGTRVADRQPGTGRIINEFAGVTTNRVFVVGQINDPLGRGIARHYDGLGW